MTAEPVSPATGADCQAEIEAYRELLASDLTLPTLQAPLIGECLADAGDQEAALIVYQEALESELDRVTEVAIRQALGDLLLERGDYAAAVAQYDAILAVAETQVSRSRALYQAGQAELLAGNPEAGYARFLTLVQDYPETAQSYPALRELLAAGYAVDDYVQGLVTFNAQTYGESAAAFARVVETSADAAMEAYLYLAWSLEKSGDVDGALAQLDALIASRETPEDGTAPNLTGAAQGRIERAKVNDRAGRSQAALDDYQAYLSLYPQGADAPYAAWRWAVLAENLSYRTLAVERYLAFGQAYPNHDDAAQALFRAGYLSWELGDSDGAQAIWRQAFETYPGRDYGSASLLWLLKTLPESQMGPYREAALNGNGYGYYGPRAAHLASGVEPFVTAGRPNLNRGETGREFAESWLRQWLGLAPATPVADLSGQLAADPRLAWAERLWSSGSRAEAARQFELLRSYYADDPLANYQLALYFRDLGLYKSSILAALSLMNLAGVGASGAPRFIARLAYPAYYADQIAAEARQYGYDPLLQLALIREESYFDPSATSALGARGLSQILPETGAYVAGQLGWPGYDSGALYRPDTAIAFGAYLLDQQLDRYGGNIAAALAAYNAGPGFADGWAQLEADDFDHLIEIIDFPETQRYIKQIYITHAIYRFLYT
jgi:soluble lytic murein transglycosylase